MIIKLVPESIEIHEVVFTRVRKDVFHGEVKEKYWDSKMLKLIKDITQSVIDNGGYIISTDFEESGGFGSPKLEMDIFLPEDKVLKTMKDGFK